MRRIMIITIAVVTINVIIIIKTIVVNIENWTAFEIMVTQCILILAPPLIATVTITRSATSLFRT